MLFLWEKHQYFQQPTMTTKIYHFQKSIEQANKLKRILIDTVADFGVYAFSNKILLKGKPLLWKDAMDEMGTENASPVVSKSTMARRSRPTPSCYLLKNIINLVKKMNNPTIMIKFAKIH